jgi:hypothetical protein
MGTVHPFPGSVTAQANVRGARRMIAKLEHALATCDPESRDIKERVTAGSAPVMLDYWRDALREAEAELAAWQNPRVLSYAGKVYPDMEGRA